MSPTSDSRYEVRNEEIESALRELAQLIDAKTPDGIGFALLLFPFKGEGMFYISNAQRSDMIEAVQEFVRVQKAKGY